MRRIALPAAILGLAGFLTSCSLLGPPPGRIDRWLQLPEPGATYTYAVTTTWHDGSRSSEERSYLVERVEERADGVTVVKLADPDRLTAVYWLVDHANGSIHESPDAEIDGSDLLPLQAPVQEGEQWSSGSGSETVSYEIQDVRFRGDTEMGKVNDLVQVTARYSALSSMEMTIQWSPEAGLVSYAESYRSGTSYIREYRRDLTDIRKPR